MTDHEDGHEDGHEPELHDSPLSPADDERIRRLLAEARHSEPIPEAVAARLDEVLAGLSAGRNDRDADEDRRAPVIDLAARRRRTTANLLVAAAAVLVVGFGITQVLPNGVSGGDDGPTATSAEDAAAGGSADSGGGDVDNRNAEPEAGPQGPTEYDGGAAGKAFRIRSERFGPDVRRLRTQLLQDGSQALLEYRAPECLTADVGAGQVVAATYDNAPAAIVLRTPSGDVQVVDLYLCGDGAPRRSITLTAP